MRPSPHRNRGATLLVVLWVVAALTILVTGLVQSQRSELRLAGAARAQLMARAAGMAAIHQVAQQLAASTQAVDRLLLREAAAGGRAVRVEVMPLTGLIDLNSAPEPLLAELLRVAGGLDATVAAAQARAITDGRRPPGPGGREARIEVAEELLALPGFDYDLFARIAPLVTTDIVGSGRVHALAAPPEVLLVLARGRGDLAQRVAEERDAGAPAIDTTRLESAYLDASVSSHLRLSARVPHLDGAEFVVWADVDLRPDRAGSSGGAPWRLLRSGVRRIAPGGVLSSRDAGG